MKKSELLAPAGDFDKLKTAFHFGADAVYCGGSAFSLRANAKNFDDKMLGQATEYTHNLGKKIYVAANIFAKNSDFANIEDYFKMLNNINVDAVIISDAGILSVCKQVAPQLEIHLSTQANTTNKYSAKFWADQGVKRIVLARETSLSEIAEIREFLSEDIEIEAFVHGAMCISYSGRCLLSNALSHRASNRGDCVQSCRWEYNITEIGRGGNPLTLGEVEGKGSYILNSKDLNMIQHIDKLIQSGVYSFKIEGRMKSPYYVASVVNAYRKAIDSYYANSLNYQPQQKLIDELYKNSHRDYTTGFYFDNADSVCLDTSQPKCDYDFMAQVLGYDQQKGMLIVEQRNRFKVGDCLEILSVNDKYWNKTINIQEMTDSEGQAISDAKLVQQIIYIKTDIQLEKLDILRKRKIQ